MSETFETSVLAETPARARMPATSGGTSTKAGTLTSAGILVQTTALLFLYFDKFFSYFDTNEISYRSSGYYCLYLGANTMWVL